MHRLAEAERHNALSWPSGRSLRRLKLASCACNLLKLVIASTSQALHGNLCSGARHGCGQATAAVFYVEALRYIVPDGPFKATSKALIWGWKPDADRVNRRSHENFCNFRCVHLYGIILIVYAWSDGCNHCSDRSARSSLSFFACAARVSAICHTNASHSTVCLGDWGLA